MSIPSSDGTIHAVYKTPVPGHGSELDVIDKDAGGGPGAGEVEVTWNQQGPKGDTGDQGPQGEPGPSGSTLYYVESLEEVLIPQNYENPGTTIVDGPSVTIDVVANSIIYTQAIVEYTGEAVPTKRVLNSANSGQWFEVTDTLKQQPMFESGTQTLSIRVIGGDQWHDITITKRQLWVKVEVPSS